MRRSERVLPDMKRILRAGGPAVHLVPDRRTLSRRRDMYYRLAAEEGTVPQDVPVHMMGGWIGRLSRRFGLWVRRLAPWEQLALLRLCQGEVELPEDSDLAGVWDRPGTVSSLHRFVSEARARGLFARHLEGSLPGEVHRVIEMYERRLEDQDLADRSRLFGLIVEALDRDREFELDCVMVEGFSSFDHWEKKLLLAVSGRSRAMRIYMPSDRDMPDVYAPETELRGELGPLFSHVTTYAPAEGGPTSLSRRLFRGGEFDNSPGVAPAVQIWTVADERKQNERLGRFIKEQLSSGDVRPGDCCVLVRRPDHLADVARQLRRLGIPVAHAGDRSLMDTRLGQTLSLLLDVMSDPRAGQIARLASSPYISSEWSGLARLGAYVREGQSGRDIIDSLEKVRDSLTFRLQDGRFRWEDPVDLEEVRREVEEQIRGLDSLLPLLSMPETGAPGELRGHLVHAISSLEVTQRIEDAAREDGGRTPSIMTDLAAQRSFSEQMDRGMRQLAAEWPGDWDRDLFLRIVRDLLDRQRFAVPACIESLELHPPEGRGVFLSPADQPEIGAHRVVILPYMVSDVFPAKPTPSWIERSFLPRSSWEDPLVRYRRENELFYRCACSAEEHLVLVHPAELGETPQVPSPYLHEIEGAGKWTDYTRESGGISRAASWRDLRESLLLAGGAGGSEIEGLLSRSLAADGVPPTLFERALEAERERWGPSMGRWDGVIVGTEEARSLGDLFPTDARVSPTQLNLFAECPFHFFAAQALRLKGRFAVDNDISAALLGRLYHTILEQYYSERIIDLALEHDGALDGRGTNLQSLVGAACEELRGAMGWIEEGQWLSLQRRAVAALEAFLAFEEERRLAAVDDEEHLFPWRTERRFSLRLRELFPGFPGDALSELQIRGVMDRVDRTDAPGSSAADRAVVFDYKLSSSPPGLDEMRRGLDLQMPLYVLAARAEFSAVTIAGGGYLSIGKAHAKAGLYTRDAADLLRLDAEKTSVSGDEFEDVLRSCRDFIVRYWERIRRGDFPVSPTNVRRCSYCQYDGICRFEWERRGSKLRRGGESSVLSH